MATAMDVRRFFILETLLISDASERSVMSALWQNDEANRNERNEPWAWYYNTTKCFAQMERKGWIEENVGEDSRKQWSITAEGSKAFLDAISEGTIFSDSLYVRKKNKVTALAAKAV